MTDALSPSRALEEAAAARAHVAARAECPASMHVLTGLLLASMVAIQALPTALDLVALAGVFCAIGLVVLYRRRRYGFFVNGYRRGRTLWVALALLAFVEAVLFGSIWLKEAWRLAWGPLAGGALVFPAAVFGSYRWQAAYRADLASAGG